MPKLSEMVAELENDFSYQYGYNSELIKENKSLKQDLECYVTEVFALRKYEFRVVSTLWLWVITIMLLLSTWSWVLFCPKAASDIKFLQEQIRWAVVDCQDQ